MGLALETVLDSEAAASLPMADAGKPAQRQPDEDDELLRRIGLNDEAAFRGLVERHVDRSYALALRVLRNAADADDVVQDVLLKVWQNRGTWQAGKAKFSTWLYRVVTNRCLDLRRRPRTEDMDNAPEQADEHPDALTSMQRLELRDQLERSMAHLPDQQRIALILSYTDDLSNAEIAEIMETTVAAVESLLKRGRQQLRHSLRNAAGDVRELFTKD
jgi:RNA polymerase sigma-70 factor, ECF subfamily